jgi:hypothetical protein
VIEGKAQAIAKRDGISFQQTVGIGVRDEPYLCDAYVS